MPQLLYVANGFEGSTTLDRKVGLEAAGWKVIHFKTDRWEPRSPRILRAIERRLGFGPLTRKFNLAIIDESRKLKPDVVWIDKGIWITPDTVRKLKTYTSLVVHYTPDPAIKFHRTRNFLASIKEYDLLFTTKSWELSDYDKLLASKVVLTRQSTSLSRTRRVEIPHGEQHLFCCDVAFVGHAEPHYVNIIKGIVTALPHIKVRIWGPWKTAVEETPRLAAAWGGRPVYGVDYCKAMSGAKIGLGLLTKLVPETETTRTFEIPACKTFLLAERTQAHEQYFHEGFEAEFFSSPREAIEKISYYLDNEIDREQIAAAGHLRFNRSGYDSESVMKECSNAVMQLLDLKSQTHIQKPV
jgi:spore maturation protein CgeB